MFHSIYFSRLNRSLLLIPVAVNYFRVLKGITSNIHLHPVYHLHIIHTGSGFYENSISKVSISEGDILLVNPMEKHVFFTPDETLHNFAFNFMLADTVEYPDVKNIYKLMCMDILKVRSNEYQNAVSRLMVHSSLSTITSIETENSKIIYPKDGWKKIKNIIANFDADLDFLRTNYNNFDIQFAHWYLNRSVRFFTDFISAVSLPVNQSDALQKKKKSMIFNMVHEYLVNKITEKYSLVELSNNLGYNKEYLCKYFKERTGQSIGEYMNMLKIRQAARLLRKTEKSITEIAYELSFYSSQHFSNVFKKIKKISPRNFRKNLEAW